MITSTWPPDLLRIGDLTCFSLAELIDLAARMKAEPNGWDEALAGQSLACVLDGPSTRTRLSAEAAAHRLGMVPVALHKDDLRLDRLDAIDDTGRMLSRYAGAVVARNIAQDVLARLARAATVPIINGHSPSHHPGQALADLLTLRERFGALEGLTVAYVGAAGSVSRSLVDAAVIDGRHSVVWEQVANRVPTEEAVIFALATASHGERS
jgi:ornithine carbamoyltransferase